MEKKILQRHEKWMTLLESCFALLPGYYQLRGRKVALFTSRFNKQVQQMCQIHYGCFTRSGGKREKRPMTRTLASSRKITRNFVTLGSDESSEAFVFLA